jgi:hypothetical protein
LDEVPDERRHVEDLVEATAIDSRVYLSTDAGQSLTSVLERSTYVPALDKAAYNGGDDFLGSARAGTKIESDSRR